MYLAPLLYDPNLMGREMDGMGMWLDGTKSNEAGDGELE